VNQVQQTLESTLRRRDLYGKEHPRRLSITKQMANFVATMNIANSIVEQAEFLQAVA
jgi:hypothetical protein